MFAKPFPTRPSAVSGSPVSGTPVSQSPSAPISVEISDHEIGCGGPDTYIASLISAAREYVQSVVADKPRSAYVSAQPKFDPWEHSQD